MGRHKKVLHGRPRSILLRDDQIVRLEQLARAFALDVSDVVRIVLDAVIAPEDVKDGHNGGMRCQCQATLQLAWRHVRNDSALAQAVWSQWANRKKATMPNEGGKPPQYDQAEQRFGEIPDSEWHGRLMQQVLELLELLDVTVPPWREPAALNPLEITRDWTSEADDALLKLVAGPWVRVLACEPDGRPLLIAANTMLAGPHLRITQRIVEPLYATPHRAFESLVASERVRAVSRPFEQWLARPGERLFEIVWPSTSEGRDAMGGPLG